MSQAYIPVEIRQLVASAARERCGYCLSAQDIMGIRLHFEHIIPLVKGGLTIEENLWLACPLCNGFKGTQTHAIDPETNEMVPLFHPRLQQWREHFAWSDDGTEILGQTPIGRATTIALKLNNISSPLAVGGLLPDGIRLLPPADCSTSSVPASGCRRAAHWP